MGLIPPSLPLSLPPHPLFLSLPPSLPPSCLGSCMFRDGVRMWRGSDDAHTSRCVQGKPSLFLLRLCGTGSGIPAQEWNRVQVRDSLYTCCYHIKALSLPLPLRPSLPPSLSLSVPPSLSLSIPLSLPPSLSLSVPLSLPPSLSLSVPLSLPPSLSLSVPLSLPTSLPLSLPLCG